MSSGDATAAPVEADRVRALLRQLPLFSELSDEDVDRLCRVARRLRYAAGSTLIEEGVPGTGLFVVVSGELEVSTEQRGRELVLARRGPGDVLGEMSLLEQIPHSATVRATTECVVVLLEPRTFQRLLARRPRVAARLLRTLATRLRSTEASLMAREKLASLGTLAAGLAHELNNPASAIRRATSQLRETAMGWRHWSVELGRLTLDESQTTELREMERAAAEDVEDAAPVSPLALAEAEDRLIPWLEARGVDMPADTAAALVAGGWTLERVRPLADRFDSDALPVVLSWHAATLTARELLQEIEISASAISSIVQATKSYAYLDRAPVEEVDVVATLEATLTILTHALKHGVDVVREYRSHPRIEGFGSELTQVWTNLIDNAIDAMEGKGVLEVRVEDDPADPDHVVVEITDSGAGIPAEIRPRLFEPFFTTKEPGKGIGLGLHVVHDVVVNRHRGRLDVTSSPGRTTFRVRLPRRIQATGTGRTLPRSAP